MEKELISNSPFIGKDFIKSAEILSDKFKKQLFDYYEIHNNTVSFFINRDFVDYRITPYFSKEQITELNIKHFNLDSLSYFQIREFLDKNEFSSIEIKKSDVSVFLKLPTDYEQYLNMLSKKNRHELKRKKRIFEERFGLLSSEKSKDKDIFDNFIKMHKKSTGKKSNYMSGAVEDFYRSLYDQEDWFIYYLSFEGSMISSAFVYESEIVDYLYNSCRDHNLDEYNTGTYLNDQLLQNSFNNSKKYFDFLKGDEKYKFDFGGQVHQLYDLKIKV